MPYQTTKGFEGFSRLMSDEDWFEVHQITDTLIVIHEPRHYEGTTIPLLLGRDRAVLIDSGCGIGDLRALVGRITALPVTVVNTHSHLDHLGGNHQFGTVMMFDHPVTRQIAADGVPAPVYRHEVLLDGLVQPPWPAGFDPDRASLRRFDVSHWLTDGDKIAIDGTTLEVLFTPGEPVDNICLLDRGARVLFSSDIVLLGGVWSHLPGGNVADLANSYRRLMQHYDAFDHIVPSHGQPWLDKALLPRMLTGAEAVLAGAAHPQAFTDPWGRRIRKYEFGDFNIQAADDGA